MGRVRNYLYDLDGIELVIILIFVVRKAAVRSVLLPYRFNRSKIVFTYSLCLLITLGLATPEAGQVPDLIELWLVSWLLTASMYQWMPGR